MRSSISENRLDVKWGNIKKSPPSCVSQTSEESFDTSDADILIPIGIATPSTKVKLLTHPAISTHAITSVTTPTFRRQLRKKSLICSAPQNRFRSTHRPCHPDSLASKLAECLELVNEDASRFDFENSTIKDVGKKARLFRVDSVPFFIVNGEVMLSREQQSDAFLKAFNQQSRSN